MNFYYEADIIENGFLKICHDPPRKKKSERPTQDEVIQNNKKIGKKNTSNVFLIFF